MGKDFLKKEVKREFLIPTYFCKKGMAGKVEVVESLGESQMIPRGGKEITYVRSPDFRGQGLSGPRRERCEHLSGKIEFSLDNSQRP